MSAKTVTIIFNTGEATPYITTILEEVSKISTDTLLLSACHLDIKQSYSFYNNISDALELCNDFINNHNGNLLIINNTYFKAEEFAELNRILLLAERHCAVSPRGNNADILSVPLSEHLMGNTITFQKAKACYNSIKNMLPPYHIIPHPVSTCVLLKGSLIKKFGLFDTTCNDLNQALITWYAKIGQYGYSSISANHIFFENNTDRHTSSIKYLKKYPCINTIYHEYLNYHLLTYDRFASVIDKNYYKKPKILLVMLQLIPVYNGTSEYAFSLAERFAEQYSDRYDFHLLISIENAAFFNVNKKFKHIVQPENISETYHIGLTFTQIVFTDILTILNKHCLKVIHTVFDLIYHRSYYISVNTNMLIFQKAVVYSDAIITISNFTKNDLLAAFPSENNIPHIDVIYPAVPKLSTTKEMNLPFDNYFLIFGSTLKHKLLSELFQTINQINANFIIVGFCPKDTHTNIYAYPSGKLSYELIASLYKNSSALIFPSEYEGFGLPIIHSLMQGKKVIISRNEINIELQQRHSEQKDNFIFFNTFDEIKNIIEETDFTVTVYPENFDYTYDDATRANIAVIERVLNEPINYTRLEQRNNSLIMLSYGKRSIPLLLKEYGKKKYPILFNLTKKLYKLIKKLR